VILLNAEAKYYASGAAAREVLWIWDSLEEMEFPHNGPTKIYCDSHDKKSIIPCKNKTYQKDISIYLLHCKS
jgi:hypothetical protein